MDATHNAVAVPEAERRAVFFGILRYLSSTFAVNRLPVTGIVVHRPPDSDVLNMVKPFVKFG